jgi:hypothetical protein
VLQQRHLRRFGFGLIASRNQHNRRWNQKQNNGAEEEPKGRSKKSFQEKSRKKRPGKKNGISDRRFSGNIIPPLTPFAGVRGTSDLLGIWVAGVLLVEAAQGGFEAMRIPGFEYLNHCLGLIPQLRYGGKQG